MCCVSLFVSQSVQGINAACLSGWEESGEESDDRPECDYDKNKPGRCRKEADACATKARCNEVEKRIAHFATEPSQEDSNQASEETHEGCFYDKHKGDA